MEECISKETVISKPDHKAAHDTFVLQYSVKVAHLITFLLTAFRSLDSKKPGNSGLYVP